MHHRQTGNGETRHHVIVLSHGDSVSSCLLEFAHACGVGAAHFSGIGAFSHARIAYFDLEKKDYLEIEVDEQVEVLSLLGNLTRYEGKPKLHAHVVLGRRDGSTIGGHLLSGSVDPTLEVFVTELADSIRREMDERTDLPLIHLPRGRSSD